MTCGRPTFVHDHCCWHSSCIVFLATVLGAPVLQLCSSLSAEGFIVFLSSWSGGGRVARKAAAGGRRRAALGPAAGPQAFYLGDGLT